MSINKVILVGNLTKDAEIRTVGQQQVASFGLATSERFTDRNGQKQELTEFHNIELWGNAGVYPYLKKGTQVYVEGSIKTDKWTDQQGQPHETKKIRAFTLQLVGQRPQQAQQPAPQQYQQPMPPQYQQPAPPQYQQPIPPAGYPGAPQNPQQQSYAPIATPPQPQYQQPAPPPAPAVAPPMAQQLDPNNYPGNLPF
ncbi:MAG: single-stranded DNA-binding protein [Bacteroidales bacterium]|nr:single-stranded DNA-binding protein [Bacteroidales bacterium]